MAAAVRLKRPLDLGSEVALLAARGGHVEADVEDAAVGALATAERLVEDLLRIGVGAAATASGQRHDRRQDDDQEQRKCRSRSQRIDCPSRLIGRAQSTLDRCRSPPRARRLLPRTILYTGKGGVGKTSVAAATARRCAADGLRTIVLSTDPAHSLGDSLEQQLGPHPREISPLLWAQQIEAQAEMESNWAAVRDWLGRILADRGVLGVAAEELTVPPGMDELFSLLQIRAHHAGGDYDVIVVDCAPTGETLRLLSFPDVARWWLDKVLPWERRLVSAARPFAKTFLDVPLPGDDVFADVQRLVGNLIAMNEILRDREHTSIRLVMNPDRMVIREAQRTFTYLNLYGYLTDAVVVNRVFPEEVSDSYFGAWRDRQREQIEAVREGFAPVPMLQRALLPRRGRSARRCSTGSALSCSPATGRSGSCTPSSPSGSAPRTAAPCSRSRSRSPTAPSSTSARSARS